MGDKVPVDLGKSVIPQQVDECSLVVPEEERRKGVCMGNESKFLIEKFTKKNNITDALVEAKSKLKCNTTRCVLNHLGDAGRKDKEIYLKVEGPTDVSLLNNFNIDNTLKQWTFKYKDFFPYDFNMRDYEKQGKTLHTIEMLDLYTGNLKNSDIRSRIIENGESARPFRMAACVINTDWYSGRGKHWMALFVDMRNSHGPWTVEFFNSSGNAPQTEYADWLEKTKIELEQIIEKNNLPVSGVVIKHICITHQRSRTECGVYSLFYIYCRLNGMSVEYFQRNRIPDEVMFEFRQHLFYDKNRDQVKVFDYVKFAGSTNILWE
jgi:hypothetical protein